MEAISFNGGKTVTNYSYFPLTGRLSTLNAYTVPGGISIIYKLYDYNKSGDITAVHDLKNDIDYTYAYDHLHRLISEQSSGTGSAPGATVEVIEFTYTQESGKPVHAPIETKLNGTLTRYGYTPTGTRLNKQEGLSTTFYEVNPDNQIKTITVAGVTTNFFYDADGKRIKKTQGASATLYFGETLEIINDTPTLYVFAGNLRIAKMTGSSTEYYHKDHQGSTNALTTESGSIIDTAEYLPYGPDRSPNGLLNHSAYKYTDQEQDAGTGLYNYDARLYDPVLGQFVMADTIVPDPFNPQSLNRFAYCLNNPVRYVDPTGHSYGSGTDGGSVSFGHDGSDAANAGDCPGGAGLDGYPDSWGLGNYKVSNNNADSNKNKLVNQIPNFFRKARELTKNVMKSPNPLKAIGFLNDLFNLAIEEEINIMEEMAQKTRETAKSNMELAKEALETRLETCQSDLEKDPNSTASGWAKCVNFAHEEYDNQRDKNRNELEKSADQLEVIAEMMKGGGS